MKSADKFQRSVFMKTGEHLKEFKGPEIQAMAHKAADGTPRKIGYLLHNSYHTINDRLRRARGTAGASDTITALMVVLFNADEDYRTIIFGEVNRLREVYALSDADFIAYCASRGSST